MKAIVSFFKKPLRYLVLFLFALVLFTGYVFLDAFYIERIYAVLLENPVNLTDIYYIDTEIPRNVTFINRDDSDRSGYDAHGEEEIYVRPGILVATHVDDNVNLTIEQFEGVGGYFYVAEVKLSSVNFLRTALHNGMLGRNITAPVSVIAEDNNALFAINGDYAGFNDYGVIMRNGQILRMAPRQDDQYGLVIDIHGDLLLFPEEELSEEKLREVFAVNAFSLGPTLIVDGEISISEPPVSVNRSPRTAIGQKGPLHYIFIVTDGRREGGFDGMEFPELAAEFAKRGVITAYNLDGGGTSTMWFNGELVNTPSSARMIVRERNTSDIVFIPRS